MRTIRAVFSPQLEAADDGRTIKGMLLPFGEIGYTSYGPVTVTGGITWPEDLAGVLLNIEHDPGRLVGRATSLEITEAGVQATFSIVNTRAGDDALEEVRAGLRGALSVEMTALEEDKPGEISAGEIIGAGLVSRPAFESARLAATHAATEETQSDPGQEEPETDQPNEEDTEMSDARIGASTPVTAGAIRGNTVNVQDLTAAFAGAYGNTQLKAALADIVPANWLAFEQPEYVGELWNGKAFQRRAIPAFNHATLKSRKISGWRWVTRPEVGPYEGNKAEIPTNTVSTEAVDIEIQRIAGGHDIDRIYVDFESPEFWAAYFAAMTESYARQSDAIALAEVADAAPEVTPGEVPAGIAPALAYIVDGVLAVLNETDALPDTAFVAPDLWRALMFTTHNDRLAYLDAALGFNEGTLNERKFAIVPESRIEAGSALVTTREAATVHELGGGTPIRVQALDVAHGGVDAAVFGYMAVNIHDAAGLAMVKPAAGQ